MSPLFIRLQSQMEKLPNDERYFLFRVKNNLLCFQNSSLSQNSTSQDIEEVLLFEAT
jgi:hypothetical protein